MLACLTGAILLWKAPRTNIAASLTGVYLVGAFAGAFSMTLAFIPSNTGGYTKKVRIPNPLASDFLLTPFVQRLLLDRLHLSPTLLETSPGRFYYKPTKHLFTRQALPLSPPASLFRPLCFWPIALPSFGRIRSGMRSEITTTTRSKT